MDKKETVSQLIGRSRSSERNLPIASENHRKNVIEILIQTIDGRTVAFEIMTKIKIRDIKEKVNEQFGLAPEEQILVFQGGILDGDKTADEYQIEERSVINVISRLRGGIQIFIRTLYGKTVAFEIYSNAKISDIKMKVQEKIGLEPEQQRLVYQGAILEDNKTANEYQICERSVINLTEILKKDGIAIFAKLLDERTVMIDTFKFEKVSYIKWRLYERFGICPDEQLLVFGGILLEDDIALNAYGITYKSVINVVVRLRDYIQIFAKPMNGKIYAITIYKNEKIRDIKQKLQEKIGLAPEEQILVFEDEILEDDKTAEEYQICEKSVINVVARLRHIILIFAKTMDGKTVDVEICKNERISDIKKKMHERIGLAPEQQILVFQSLILEDDKTAGQYQMKERSMINVVVPMRNEIIDIKKRVPENIGLAPEEQILVFEARILEDDKTTDEHQIEERSVINVIKQLR